MTDLKKLRLEKKITQKNAADIARVSLRSYKTYENDTTKINSLKYLLILDALKKYVLVDEEHGVLTENIIRQVCQDVFDRYNVNYCYLFGSYAKGNAKPTSDVDLLISTEEKGLKYFGMIEEVRESLKKKVDMLDVSQLKDNLELTNEILKDGIKIYGQKTIQSPSDRNFSDYSS